MHVVFGVERELVVDHGGERFDVEAARGHVGCHHHPCLARLEGGERLVALLLILVAVDLHHVVAVAVEEVAESIRLDLPVDEDERLIPVSCLQQVAQQRTATSIVHRHDHLADVVVRLVAARHLDRDRITQEVVGEGADRLGEGGGEEEALPSCGDQRKDALQVGHEAHVEHPIGLVEHQDGDLREVHRLRAGVVEEPSGRGDEDLDAGEQHLLLRRHRYAAVDDAAAQREVLSVRCTALRDLHGEFARRRQHECAHRMARRARRGGGERLQQVHDRQDEGGGLPGAGLRRAEQVAPLEDVRDRLLLDRRGLGVPLGLDGAQEFGGKVQVGKRGHWRTDYPTERDEVR